MKCISKAGLLLCALTLLLSAQGDKAQGSKAQDSKAQDSKAQDSKAQDSKAQDSKEQDSKEQVYELGKDSGVAPPRIAHQVAPEHPSKGFRVSGTVLVGLVVTSKGEPDEVKVLRSLEKDVDQSAVDAVKQWRFEPATKGGQPVAVRISVEIRFHDM